MSGTYSPSGLGQQQPACLEGGEDPAHTQDHPPSQLGQSGGVSEYSAQRPIVASNFLFTGQVA